MVGIEAALRPADPIPGPDDGAIEIDRGPSERTGVEGRGGDLPKQGIQTLAKARGDLLEPAGDRALIRHPLETCKAQEERVPRHHPGMAQPQAAHQQQADHEQRHPQRAVVRIEAAIREDGSEPVHESGSLEEASEELQAGVSGERLLRELDPQIALDTGAHSAFP